MATERVYDHRKRRCEWPSNCTWPLCNCAPAPVPELTDDRPAIRKSLRESRQRHTIRVNKQLT